MRTWITAATLVTLASMSAFAAEVKIDDLIVANTIPVMQRDTELKAANTFYQFWNTGDKSLLKAAISPNFIDHTLPAGRPQGPKGPAFASEHFRAAAPDLMVARWSSPTIT
jgi:SnoaL-like polyketide cyclase